MDRVSILIPCYNVEKHLPQCLDSILAQSYDNIQIVITDDGSNDNTWSIIRHYVLIDPRIEAYTRENKGVAATRNELLKHVEGKYVLFIDSDDWIEPDMVEFLLGKLNQYEADVVTCGMVINDSMPSPEYNDILLDQKGTIQKFLFHKELKGSLWNKLIKTSLLHDLFFDPFIGYGEDALFCWQVFQRVNKVVLTDRELYHYRMNQASISHRSFGKQKLTGDKVWKTITEDTISLWPEYADIAKARWGLENMYLIRQAGQSNYTKLDDIRPLQKNVRRFIPQMKSTGLLSGEEAFNATMMSRWYGYAIIYHWLNQLKRLFR